MTDENIIKKIEERIDSYENEMIALQIALTSIPALAPENGGDGEYEKAGYLEEYLKQAGFDNIRRFDAPDDRVSSRCRPNIVVNIPGSNPERTVWILTHTDVVPPGELKLWSNDPYKAYVKDGRIYGRGIGG